MDAAIVDTGIDGSHPALNVDYTAVFHTHGKADNPYLNWSIFGNPDDADVISYSFGGGQTNGDSAFEHFIDAIVYESR